MTGRSLGARPRSAPVGTARPPRIASGEASADHAGFEHGPQVHDPRQERLDHRVDDVDTLARVCRTRWEALDQGGFHSTGANPDRVTVPTGSSGLYWLHGAVFFLNYGHSGALAVTKNGTRIVGNQIFASSIAGQTCRVDLLARLDAADVLRLEIIGSAGSTWSAGSGALGFESRFQGTKLS